jgi:hypothetical protein
MQKSSFNSAELSATYVCKSKDDEVFRLCYGKYGNITIFFITGKENYRFIALQICEMVKRQNVNYGKKLKR